MIYNFKCFHKNGKKFDAFLFEEITTSWGKRIIDFMGDPDKVFDETCLPENRFNKIIEKETGEDVSKIIRWEEIFLCREIAKHKYRWKYQENYESIKDMSSEKIRGAIWEKENPYAHVAYEPDIVSRRRDYNCFIKINGKEEMVTGTRFLMYSKEDGFFLENRKSFLSNYEIEKSPEGIDRFISLDDINYHKERKIFYIGYCDFNNSYIQCYDEFPEEGILNTKLVKIHFETYFPDHQWTGNVGYAFKFNRQIYVIRIMEEHTYSESIAYMGISKDESLVKDAVPIERKVKTIRKSFIGKEATFIFVLQFIDCLTNEVLLTIGSKNEEYLNCICQNSEPEEFKRIKLKEGW